MALRIGMITIDCVDPKGLAAFWTAALDATVVQDIEGEFLVLAAGDGVRLGLQRVPEPRIVKNRIHFDLGTEDRPAEVERVVGLGATVLEEYKHPGMAWTVLLDPEGNEFCIGSRNG
jgi:predicted enzyme related to lactoylglutathione lyase